MLRHAIWIFAFFVVVPAQATEAGWALLRDGGHVVLLRHAMAQATTEPANFDIEKCSTQRNLTDRGAQQARKIGALFAARAAPIERVLSSRYCRTMDTARLAFEDDIVEPFDALDPISKDEQPRKAQIEAIMKEIRDFSGSGNLILVTQAGELPGGDIAMHGFETLTLAPFDQRLLRADLLTREELDWLNAYHARVLAEIGPMLDGETLAWLEKATAQIA